LPHFTSNSQWRVFTLLVVYTAREPSAAIPTVADLRPPDYRFVARTRRQSAPSSLLQLLLLLLLPWIQLTERTRLAEAAAQ